MTAHGSPSGPFSTWRPYEHVHEDTDVRNGREHLPSTLVGTQVALRIRGDRLVLGRWQRVLPFDFSGPKERRVNVAALAEG